MASQENESDQIHGDLTGAHDAIIRAAAAAPVVDDHNPLLTMLNAMLREARAHAWDEGRASGRDYGSKPSDNPYRRAIPPGGSDV